MSYITTVCYSNGCPLCKWWFKYRFGIWSTIWITDSKVSSIQIGDSLPPFKCRPSPVFSSLLYYLITNFQQFWSSPTNKKSKFQQFSGFSRIVGDRRRGRCRPIYCRSIIFGRRIRSICYRSLWRENFRQASKCHSWGADRLGGSSGWNSGWQKKYFKVFSKML